jgi:hypothetical protein
MERNGCNQDATPGIRFSDVERSCTMTHINTIWCQISTLSSRHHYLVIVTCWRKTVATFFSLILSAAAYFCIAATTAGVAMSDGVNREYHTSSLDSMDGVGGKKKKKYLSSSRASGGK